MGREQMAIKYRCCLLDVDRTAAVELIEADDDASAVIEADKMLAASNCTTVEVWQGDREVSILSRKGAAA
jgi:hypothetical protein